MPNVAARRRLRDDRPGDTEDRRHAHSDDHEPRPERRPGHLRPPVAPNGVDIAGATGATLNLATAGNGDKGDQIALRVTA